MSFVCIVKTVHAIFISPVSQLGSLHLITDGKNRVFNKLKKIMWCQCVTNELIAV